MAERHLRYRGAFASFGQYTVKERRWHCQNCGVCKLKSTLQDILAQEQLYPPVPVQYLEYSTVSTQPIPFKLSRDSAKTYHEQITQGLRLPTNLFQSTPFCIHGNIFNKKKLELLHLLNPYGDRIYMLIKNKSVDKIIYRIYLRYPCRVFLGCVIN